MTLYRLSGWGEGYLVAEEDELAEDCESLEVLGEGPGEVSEEGAVEGGVEEQGQHQGQGDQVVAFYGVQVLAVAALEEDYDRVEDVGGKEGGQELLHFEDEVSSLVVGEVALPREVSTL